VRLPGGTLHEIFRERVRAAPGRVALSTPDEEIGYGELDARSDRLADRLARLGVGPDVLVGLCARRTPEAIVGMLGILKAGGAYVPIDPDYPAERIAYLLEDCAAPIVVAARDCAEAVGARAGLVLISGDGIESGGASEPIEQAEPPEPRRAARGQDLAYVIYTSGSTGAPKGVEVEHRNLVRLFEQTDPWFGFDDGDTWALFHSISFDFSVWEIWGALLFGGRLALLPTKATRSPNLLAALLRTERVTVLNQTPSAFHQLQTVLFASSGDGTADLALRLVVFGGERLEPSMLAPWIARHGDRKPELVNMYGITETTVHCTYRRITAADLDAPGASPIGVSIPDLRVYVLDEDGKPVPDGEPGELYIAGGGVARGYLRRPELTARRFRSGAALGEERLYRSGDLAKRLPDGGLGYLGRADDQLKIRGFRIEPAEIEHCLTRLPQIAQAVVRPRDFGGGDVRLVAYLLPAPGLAPDAEPPQEAAERQARTALPRHLRPSVYKVVTEIPMTLQGKVDRDALGN